MKVLRIALFPFSLVFGFFIFVRNKLYDTGILKSVHFDIPVIAIGNLSAGGTGKTPHTEYLVRLLRKNFIPATLSRGYGRKSYGFKLVSGVSSAADAGDEPAQLKRKFGDGLIVAVDAKRVHGIQKLMELPVKPEVILLDDAFQHRAVKPGLSMLLTDYAHPFYEDHLLPWGMLRESAGGYKRAGVIIVTKTPAGLSLQERNLILSKIKPATYQQVFFSSIIYSDQLIPVDHRIPNKSLLQCRENNCRILLLTGIANASPLEDHLKKYSSHVQSLYFPDHHDYSINDLLKVRETFARLSSPHSIIITTEKDAVRLDQPALADKIKDLPLFYIPIEIGFQETDREKFDQLVLNYVCSATGKY